MQFQGNINDVAVYSYALSAAQVASNYVAAGVAPQIAQQPPASASVGEGGTLTIMAAALGTAPLAYQWQDGYNLPLMATQTNATLVLSNVSSSLLGGDSFTLTVNQSLWLGEHDWVFAHGDHGPAADHRLEPAAAGLVAAGQVLHLLGRGGWHGALAAINGITGRPRSRDRPMPTIR